MALDEWAASLIERHGNGYLALLPYDPENEYHRNDVVKLEPKNPSIRTAHEDGCTAVGAKNFGPLMGDLRRMPDAYGHPYGTMRQIKSWLGVKNHNVAITTNHVDLIDIAIAQAALFWALEDDDLAYQSGIIVNKALTRISFRGIPVVDLLRNNGSVYFNLPKSAAKYGITAEESTDFNRRMGRRLGNDLRTLQRSGKSMLLALALSGSTAKALEDSYLQIPDVDSATEKLILGRFRFVLPLAMHCANIPKDKDWYAIGDPVVLGGPADVDRLMEEMAAVTSALAERPVLYKNFSAMGRRAIEKYLEQVPAQTPLAS